MQRTSAGIDIGSSGMQVVFSRVVLGPGDGGPLRVVDRATVHHSPVAFTPYSDDGLVDERAVAAFIDAAFAEAGLLPAQVDAGAVILTGEALRRENARAIAAMVAARGGDFLCAAAGHGMEARLAAFGSGAAALSRDLRRPVLNVDIGGGTTKVALIEDGRVLHTAALHLGGRLLAGEKGDGGLRITRAEPGGEAFARLVGLAPSLGAFIADGELDRLADAMAESLLAALAGAPAPIAHERLWMGEPLEAVDGIAGVMFSGGVAEYVYGRESRDFGDVGRRLGLAIRAKLDAGRLPYPLLPAGECIRATAIGASASPMELPASRVFVSDAAALLPCRNVQVLVPAVGLDDRVDPVRVAQAIRRQLRSFDVEEGRGGVALAFSGVGALGPEALGRFAQGLVEALPITILEARALHLVLDGVGARALGDLLKDAWRVASPVLVVEGLALQDFDYLDVGAPRADGTIPVAIKSLVFREDPRSGGHHLHGDPHDHPHGDGHHTHG